MRWIDVFKKHRKVSAVYVLDLELQSLIFSNDRRRARVNMEKDNDLYFCFHPETSSNSINSLKSAIKTQKVIPVYRKKSPDNWEDLGPHKVAKHSKGKDAHGRPSIIFVVSPVA